MSLNPPPQPPAAASPASLQLWFDGQLMSHESAHLPLTTHALHYGSGVFEGIRSYAAAFGAGRAAVFRLEAHLERMRQGAATLGATLDVALACEATLRTLRANRHRDAYVRPLLWFGTGGLGLDVAPLSQHLMVASLPWKSHLGDGRQRLSVSPLRRNRAAALPPLKLCGGYVNSLLAKREAALRGFDEAMFVDDDGFVVECTGENVFLVQGGRITAVEHGDALPGITRATLMELTGATSRPVRLEELLEADEVFVCGTSAEVTSVAAIDGRSYGAAPVTGELQALYARLVRGQESRFRGWLTEV